MLVLSHRGYWLRPAEKNRTSAFERSFASSFGTETDVRDSAGRLVIAHDPPCGNEISFTEMLGIHRRYDPALPLAINIKADGLQKLLMGSIADLSPSDWFVFDMSIPDTMSWLAIGAPVFVRHSDIEPQPCFYEDAVGIWMDGFNQDWMTEADIRTHLDAGKRVCLVSPELHGRSHEPFWSRLAVMRCVHDKSLMICTDLPSEARARFGTP